MAIFRYPAIWIGDWLFGCLAGWRTFGWAWRFSDLADYLAGCLCGYSVGWGLFCCVGCLAIWLVGYLAINYLIDYLANWLVGLLLAIWLPI